MKDIDILEELSNNEHIRWANWQKYVHSKCIKNEDGSLTIPKEYVEHWEYEINTDYANLPENIKESDRREVRQILEKLKFSNLIAKNKELKEKIKEINEEYNAEQKHEMENTIPKSKVIEEIDNLYNEWSNREMGDSYMYNNKNERITIDTGYAFQGIELFIDELKNRLQSLLGKE